jgi:DNA-binding MarR family transcriptional regulator
MAGSDDMAGDAVLLQGGASGTDAAAGSKDRLRLWLRLLRASRAVEGQLRTRLAAEFGETLPRFDVLAALFRAGKPITMGALSRRLMVSNGNVTGLIERLVADGLAARRQQASDRRSAEVTLTAKGRRRFAAMAVRHEAWVAEIIGEVPHGELARMLPLLERLAPRTQELSS